MAKDRRILPPRVMSRVQLADHMARFHQSSGPVTLWQHNHDHHMVRANHGHRSAFISEENHPDWR